MAEGDAVPDEYRTQMQEAWVRQLEEKGREQWGFVCFRTSYGNEEAWAKRKNDMAAVTDEALACTRLSGQLKGVGIVSI
jgi:hypothetical protein